MSLKDLVFSLKLDTGQFIKNAGASAKSIQALANTKMTAIAKEIQRLNDGTGRNDEQIKKLTKEYAHWQSVSTKAAAQVRGEMKRVHGEAEGLNKTMSAASVAKWAAGIYGVFKATGAVIGQLRAGFADNSDLEQTRVFFTSLLGNVDLANSAIQKLRKEADITPFETKDVIAAGKGLLTAAQNNTAKMMEYVKLAERLSILNPEQGLTGAATAIKEALGGDYVSLKERFNIGLGEINGLRKAKKEGAELIDDLLKARNIGDEAIAAMGKTASGRASTILSFLGESRRLITEGIFGKISEMMGATGDWLATNGVWLQDVAKGFGMWLVDAGVNAVKWVASFKADFEAAWGYAKQIWGSFSSGSMGTGLLAVFKELGSLLVDMLKLGAEQAGIAFIGVFKANMPQWVVDKMNPEEAEFKKYQERFKGMTKGQLAGELMRADQQSDRHEGDMYDESISKEAQKRAKALRAILSGKTSLGGSADTVDDIFKRHGAAFAQASNSVFGSGLPGAPTGASQPGLVQGWQQQGAAARQQEEARAAAAEAAAPKPKPPAVAQKKGVMSPAARARLDAYRRKANNKNYGGGRGMKLQVTSLDGKIRMVSGTT